MTVEPENQFLEYKKGKGHTVSKDFWKSYSAFSNTMGGKVIFGIDEPNKYSYEVCGADNPDGYQNEILNGLYNHEKVSYSNMTDENFVQKSIDGKTVLEVTIPEAPYKKKPVYLNNRIDESYKRINDANRRMNQDELRYYFSNSRESLDSDILIDYSIDDLNEADIENYRNLLNDRTDIDYSHYSLEELLKKLGVYKKNREGDAKKYYPTVAALLFFGKFNSIQDYLPDFQIDYFRKKSSMDLKWLDRVSTGDMNFPELNIFSFYNIVLPKLYNNIDDPFKQDDNMNRSSYVSDMKSAIREAFINMLMHSYYGNGALPIKVTSFEDHFEFSNPGEMRVSREDFLMGGTSRPRNSLLASLFRRIGLAEKSGYGGQKILDVAQKNSLRVPDVILTDNSTKIRLWKTDYLSTLPKMSPYAEQIFLTLYKQNFSSKSEIIAETSLTSYYFDKGYEELSELNLISRIGKSRATRYYLELSDEMKTSRNIKNLKQLEDIMRE